MKKKKGGGRNQPFQAAGPVANRCLFNAAWRARWAGFNAGESLVNHGEPRGIDKCLLQEEKLNVKESI